ncbi:hypothetical protein TsFJ059_003359 [Trichoderma semiorbis]|uniref:Uncharacterized protein n=1 Tax=Trichoderma semiorbis TaxID=1491008 RepID=A0A9P8HPA4_9HYPO|nr:hypothetical protein TsFJ059_003359 [Trichoderma semiorbis]
MASVPATAVIDARSLKKHKLNGQEIMFIAMAAAMAFSFCCSFMWQAYGSRISEWWRSKTRGPAPSPVLIGLEDIVNRIRPARWWSPSPPELSLHVDGQQPDPFLRQDEQQVGRVRRAITPVNMIREVTLPTVRPSSDSARSAPAATPTLPTVRSSSGSAKSAPGAVSPQEMPSTDVDCNPPRTLNTTPGSIPTELSLEVTRNSTPPNPEVVSTLTLPNSDAVSTSTYPDSDAVSASTYPDTDDLSTLTLPNSEAVKALAQTKPDPEAVSSLTQPSLENTNNPAEPTLETPDSPTLPTVPMAESKHVEDGPA